MDDEARMLDALTRMKDTNLHPYDGSDLKEIIRRIVQRRERIEHDLQTLTNDLNLVASHLRHLTDDPNETAYQAREQIAVDFAEGARAFERAKLSLDLATGDLEYLRYVLL